MLSGPLPSAPVSARFKRVRRWPGIVGKKRRLDGGRESSLCDVLSVEEEDGAVVSRVPVVIRIGTSSEADRTRGCGLVWDRRGPRLF
jgi:hypothetical protein